MPEKRERKKQVPKPRPRGPVVYEFEPIGYLESSFKVKFGIPRQPGLVSKATGILKLGKDPDLKLALKFLEGFSHIWLVFVFHEHGGKKWKPTIRPPRLGGRIKVGVLASRSPHRPNPIGLSAVALNRIDLDAKGGPEIHVSGVDLMDGTPILDIKPYLAYADSLPAATSGWAGEPIARISVDFTKKAEADLAEKSDGRDLREMIIEMLELDLRPTSQKRSMPPESDQAQGTKYGFTLFSYDVKWEIRDRRFLVTDVLLLSGLPN